MNSNRYLKKCTKPSLWMLSLLLCNICLAQAPKPVKVTGKMGITYEHYGLSKNPPGTYMLPRRPWNQVRVNFQPIFQFGKNFSIPFNFSFVTRATNFAGPFAGIRNQSFGQFITNPANRFGINPKYKWAELQLGTQYLNYSNLSTGDIGIFGVGVDLRPKIFIIKLFTGSSQRGINYVAPGTVPTGTPGAYERNHWMAQLGVEKPDNFRFLINAVHGRDKSGSLSSPPLFTRPQEGFNFSVIADKYFAKKFFIKTEFGSAYYTKDIVTPPTLVKTLTFSPFIYSRASTQKDYAAEASIGRKSDKFDLSYSTKYIGAGFQTMGFPYMQPDHWDNTLNTRFTAMKNKMNVVASAGIRKNNLSSTSLKSNQFIGNINWFTQFSDKFSLNVNYNNFGFTTATTSSFAGIRNVSNDFGVTPTYTWITSKALNLMTFSYNYSKYNETILGVTTSNNTHTILVSYIPTYLQKEIAPDFSALYFYNSMPSFKNTLFTLTAGLGTPVFKKKVQLKGQLQYTLGKINSYTPNHNLIPSLNLDYKINKKLTFSTFLTTSYFKYGNELGGTFIGARYFETRSRIALLYKF